MKISILCHFFMHILSLGGISTSTSGSVLAGESYTLECSAGGSKGTFQWLGPPDGRTPVVESIPRMNIIFNATSSQLQFRPVQQSDNGSYSCNATVGGSSLLSEPVVISINGIITSSNHCTSATIMILILLFFFSSPCISPDQ